MGRKKKQHAVGNGSTGEKNQNQEELLKTLGDFTSKENWDQFFTIRGADDSFEWYAEWPQLRNVLTTQLLLPSSVRTPESSGAAPPAVKAEEVSILVPGCGNSKLSEHLYDAGFFSITNVDFSKVVISDMMRRNLRERPLMKWRVMDMTNMQFAEETFDAIVDKGGLDALMEPEIGSRLGNKYISEVKRLLKYGGKYICLTLAESHVLALLFSKFRFGWKMSLYTIAKGPSSRNVKLQTFMVVVEKDISISISEISSFMDEYSVESHGNQARELYEALEREQKVRSEYSNGCDIVYSLEDLNLGAKGTLAELEPGRRLKLILGEPGVSRHFYNAVLFDAEEDSAPFSYHYAAFIVPKIRVDDWMFSSKEGQWLIVSSSKASRLLMILLDSSNSNAAMQDIQIDLSPLVKQLAPRACGEGVPIPFMAASDGIMDRQIVNEVTSALTGPIIVDDVIYHSLDDYDDDLKCDPSKFLRFRRLTFQRSQSLIQSEALLSKEGSDAISCEIEKKEVQIASKTRKKGKQGKFDPHSSASHASSGEMKVDHNYLASSYHNGIISGLMLISLHLQGSSSARGMVKTAVIGLGAGLLPMFMKNCLPTLNIEVVELDPVVLGVAKEYFDFREDEGLQVHITDGIKFVREKADASAEGESSCKLDILIVDVDSPDSSSGLTCPAEDFVEESFLLTAKNSLSEEGLFIINLVSRSSAVKSAVYSRLKTVFGNLFSLKLEKDVNEVIFALNKDSPITEGELSKACDELERSLELENHKWCRKVIDASKLIKPLT